jgi:hypothetical protein
MVQAPQQYDFLSAVHAELDEQSAIESDLRHLADSGAFKESCRPISVPNDRAIPRLAALLDLRPSAIMISAGQRQPSHGYFLDPANEIVEQHFGTANVPLYFRRVARNESFVLYARCG